MGRFEWLEVPGKNEKTTKGRDVPPQRPEEKELDEEHYLKLADETLTEGSYEIALRYYSRALNQNHRNEAAWLGQMLCLIDLGEYKEAITWGDKALELFPGSPEITAAKGLAWGRQGIMDKAKGFSDSSIKSGKESSFVWWVRGDILIGESEQNAEFCFRKAQELDKNNWLLFLRIGKTYLSVGKPLKAKDCFQRARSLGEARALTWHWLGIAYMELGITDQARECLRRAVELKPGNPEFRRALEQLEAQGFLMSLTRKLKRFLK